MKNQLMICLLTAAVSLNAAASGPQGYEELQAAALEAYQGKDYVRMEALLREAERERPNSPRALYNLAAARALQGDGPGAMDLLEKIERMKLGYKVWDDADFKSLESQPRYQKLVEGFRRNLAPQGNAGFAFTAGVADFMPEGVAYDQDTNSFYLGSVHQRRILRITRDGQTESLVGSGFHGLYSVLGMKVEPTRKRLWVASAALPVMEGYDEEDAGRSGLWAFDRESGRLRGKFLLPKDGKQHALGDLIISSKGEIYTTDSAEGMLYQLDRSSGKFSALTEPGALGSPQGLTFAPGQRFIYIADYTRGLMRYDRELKKLEQIPGREDVCLYGIDGLYYYKGSLVAIQNGVRPNRVVRIDLDESGALARVTGMQVLAANLDEFDEPTLGVLKHSGVFYFVANSHWNRVGADNQLPALDQLSRPIVMRIDLRDRFDEPETAQKKAD